MNKVIGDGGEVADFEAPVTQLHREGLYPNAPLRIAMTSEIKMFLAIKAAGQPSPMLICFESYDQDRPISGCIHAGVEVHWSLNRRNP